MEVNNMALNTVEIEVGSRRDSARALGVVMGYMCIGLLITAISCFGFSFYFANLLVNAAKQGDAAYESVCMTLLIVMIASFVGLFIINLILSISLSKAKKGAWIPYVLYAAVMGLALAPFTMWLKFSTIGIAFGITSAIFLILFLIGYFSKADLSPLGLIGLGLLFSVIFVPLPFLILFLINPVAYSIYNVIASAVLAVVIMLFVSVDANRMNREIQGGVFTNNLALYYAYSFYSDFIMIFIRVLIIVASLKEK